MEDLMTMYDISKEETLEKTMHCAAAQKRALQGRAYCKALCMNANGERVL